MRTEAKWTPDAADYLAWIVFIRSERPHQSPTLSHHLYHDQLLMHILSYLSYLLSLASLSHVTQALVSGKFCPSACEFTLQYVIFNDTDASLSRKVRACRSQLRITSAYLCFNQYCEDDGEKEKWIKEQSTWCEENAGVKLPEFHDVLDAWAAEDIASVRRVHFDEVQSNPVVDEVALPDLTFLERAYTTMVRIHRSQFCHTRYF